jgi:hypothetical protein
MSRNLTVCVALLLLPLIAGQAAPKTVLEVEIAKTDQFTADPDAKLVVLTVMAERLSVHRNYLIYLRRTTGMTLGQIFVQQLRDRGVADAEILSLAQALNSEIAKTGSAHSPVRPILFLNTGVDHNSSGTFFSTIPEIGVDAQKIAFWVGVPYYRNEGTTLTADGIGDVYATGLLRGATKRLDLSAALSIGFPTGARDQGLGAGKVTYDAVGTIGRKSETIRPYLSAGFTNSVFSNAGYQRPFVTNGRAAHFGGGVEHRFHRLVTGGVAGFGTAPVGPQDVYSRVTTPMPTAASGTPMPGMPPGMGMTGGTTSMPVVPASGPIYMHGTVTSVSGNKVQDYGINAFSTVALHRGVSLTFSAARSVPFSLTTIRVGLGIDAARLFFPAKHF